MPKTYVQLLRTGDIINILPLCYQDFLKTGEKSNILVGVDYASVLDGVSYVNPLIWTGSPTDVKSAMEYARTLEGEVKGTQLVGSDELIRSQVYSQNVDQIQPRSDSFQKESWRLAGRIDEWRFQHPLVFDRRDFEREKALIASIPRKKKRMILVSTKGFSSPFPHSKLLFELLRGRFRSFDIIDLSEVKGERIYDLLGLFEHPDTHCIITADSAPLHLSYATSKPVIALVTDKPTLWHGSVLRSNHVSYIRYGEFTKEAVSMLDDIEEIGKPGCMWCPVRQWPRIIHVYLDRRNTKDDDEYRRNSVARKSWSYQYTTGHWVATPLGDSAFVRNSSSIGDDRELPFLKDALRLASYRAGDSDIICFTNTDSCMHPKLTETLLSAIKEHGAATSRRMDFDRIDDAFTDAEISKGNQYLGSDLFAFTKEWLQRHWSEIPDMILGAEAFDKVLRSLIQIKGGKLFSNLIYHEKHSSVWSRNGTRQESKANQHNRRLAKEWLTKNNLPLEELAGFKD